MNIFTQALAHLPALAAVWVVIFGSYWVLGLAKVPRLSKYQRALEKLDSIDIDSLGGFRWRSLMLISLTSLFLELLLIRWVASEIRVFAYFKSLVLISCFLGFGLGCYLTRKKIRISYTIMPLIVLVLLVELPWTPLRRLITNLSGFIGWFSDMHIWARAYFADNFLWGLISAGVAVSIVIPLFGLIAITFIPLGQLVGWYLENSKKGIMAYSVNVAASITGIWLYTLLCFFSTEPIVWFAVVGLGLIAFFWPLTRVRAILITSFAVILVLFVVNTQKGRWWGEDSWKGSMSAENQLKPGKSRTFWSPYQKLTIVPLMKGDETVRYILNTNDTWFQQIMDLSDSAVAKHPEMYAETPIQFHQYNLPFRFYKNPPKVLIAGAGMGNDVAAALRNGAGSVTAVEIDPLIQATGKALHFEHPYQSDRVKVHIDDARSFVQNTKEKFDLVVFSILDSHTTASHYTNIRLDNYVYTKESMEATKKLLNPDGLFVMSFSDEKPWFTKRLTDVATLAFGRRPLLMNAGVSFFVVGNSDRVEKVLASDPDLRNFVNQSHIREEEASLITDDWPYLYQQYRGIPLIVWLLSIGLIGISWLTFNKVKGSGERIQWHFFFLGAAFMLLEVQVISKVALLFGTTWLVNSIVITTLLLLILLANLTVSFIPKFPTRLAYVGLFGTLLLGYLVPTNSLFFESFFVRAAVATALYCSPVFFAGLVFISSFREAGFRAEAFGSNLLGALVGGLLESLSFLVGIKFLVIIAGLLYFISLVKMGRARDAVEVRSSIRGVPSPSA